MMHLPSDNILFSSTYFFQADDFGDPGVDGRIILKWIFKKWDVSMDWVELAQDRDKWRALVNAVMNLRVA
jgi:hypothetical protein